MGFDLYTADIEKLEFLPETDLADLAIDLDLIPEERIDRTQLMLKILPRLLNLAQKEGLPFSKWDLEDLAALPDAHRAALANVMGWPSDPKSMIKAGLKVFKIYRKTRSRSQIPLTLPLFLPALARFAAQPREAPNSTT